MSDIAKLLRDLAREQTAATEVHVPGVFCEEPVSLSVFVQDRNYLGNPPLSPVQYEAVRHIERVFYNGWFTGADGEPYYRPERDTYRLLSQEFESGKKTGTLHVGPATAWREEKYWSQPVRMTNFITLQWGKGSGKDHICRVSSMRIAYLLMCLTSPQDYFRIPEQDTIHLLNVASSSSQAQQAFFMPVVRAVKKGWFANRCVPRQNVISFEKNIEAVSGHSDAESQEGLNLLLGIADEIDAFKSITESRFSRRGGSGREPTKSAEGILNMMRSSSATRFPETFKQVRISYPRYLGSTIQNLTAAAKVDLKENGKRSRHYVSGPLATWQVNPRVPGREAFAGDYKDDPVMARSKYECKPARAINPYFRNQQAVDSCFEVRKRMPVTISYRKEKLGDAIVWVPDYHFAEDFYPIRGAAYAMHGDLSVKGDRAGIAMAHVARYSEHPTPVTDEDGAIYQVNDSRPNVKVDFVVSFTSDSSANPPREIQIRWARQLAFELIRRGFNVRRFSFDTFQCMSGDTEIPLLDGTTRKLRELEGSAPFWVYSIKDGRVVPGRCSKAWRTGFREDMVEVVLDNGETVRTTSDHRFMLRDGSYRRADQLQAGDSLMPLCRRMGRIGESDHRKVVEVRPAAPEDVFDLSVEEHHNFAVSAGVFVHNSFDSMQILKAKGIESKKVSTDISDEVYRNLRDVLYEGRVSIPRPQPTPEEPSFLLRDELFGLSRLPNGRIDHLADGSKDEADALACAVLGAIELGGAEDGTGERTHFAPPDFAVGSAFTMPSGTSLSRVWEVPSLDDLSPQW